MQTYQHGWLRTCKEEGNEKMGTDRLNMSETISTSVSAAASFSADESWGRLPKRKDMVGTCGAFRKRSVGYWRVSAGYLIACRNGNAFMEFCGESPSAL